MQNFSKPRIVISKCLGLAACRYDGGIIKDPFIEKLLLHVDYLSVCPEVEIGLGVPRPPIRIVNKEGTFFLYQPETQRELTSEMAKFAEEFLSSLKAVDGFILKYRSPSCGISAVKIYHDFSPQARTSQGRGLFADQVLKKFGYLAVTDEGKLKNFKLRENFLTKLFLLARFREVKEKGTMAALVKFHTENKLLFMAYSQARLKELGQILANLSKRPVKEVYQKYETTLYLLLLRTPNIRSLINAFTHAFGGVSQKLTSKERKLFLSLIEDFRAKRIPLSVISKLLIAWAVRFDDEYLLRQSLLNPYPEELIDLSDSGKNRED
jgi:uncharacterized protein YbgA (DUF1722 family)/uncharacterized protein YbbK (DUF523 family)